MKVPAPASSISWSVDLFAEPLDARLDEWWYFDARTVFVADGYTSFEASLWAPDGQYVARSCQLVGVFG
jgi:acyl-CoA thioesterase